MTPVGRSRPAETDAFDVLAIAIGRAVSACSPAVDVERVTRSFRAAIRPTFDEFAGHVHWPTRLTASGVPIEISLAVDGGGTSAVRCLFDVSDQRLSLAANWPRLLQVATMLTGLAPAAVTALYAAHLASSRAWTKTPVYHGVGYAADGAERASLYFFVGAHSAREFEDQFAADLAAIDASLAAGGGRRPARIHNVGYDFERTGAIRRSKFYGWLHLTDDACRVRDHVGDHPDLRAADAILSHLRTIGEVVHPFGAVLLQSSVAGPPTRVSHKAVFSFDAWAIDRRRALLETIIAVSQSRKADLSQLYLFLDVFQSLGIPLQPTWISIGPGESPPSVTFYFVPVIEPLLFRNGPLSTLPEGASRTATARGIRYLIAARQNDGSWSDGPYGDPDALVTSRVVEALSHAEDMEEALAPSRRWLADRARREVSDAFDRDPTQSLAQSLAQLTAAGSADDPRIDATLYSILQREHRTGGWSGNDDDLFVTVRVVGALSTCRGRLRPAAEAAIERASVRLSNETVRADPARVALWLTGSMLCGLQRGAPSIARGLSYLVQAQQPDGRWLATPFERSNGVRVNVDPRSLTTTALVVEALSRLQQRSGSV